MAKRYKRGPRPNIAINLGRYRKMRRPKITQGELAAASGVAHVALIEGGHRRSVRDETVEDLATALSMLLGFPVTPGELRANPPGDDAPPELVEASWQDFLKTGPKFENDEERDELRTKTAWPWGNPSVAGWYAALQLMRVTRSGNGARAARAGKGGAR